MKKVIVLGAGSLAAEIHEWIAIDQETGINIVGFWDPFCEKQRLFDLPVYKDFSSLRNLSFITGIGRVEYRKEAVNAALKAGLEATNYVHSTSLLSPSAAFGQGVFIAPNCSIAANVKVADFVHINVGCAVGHDVNISEHTILLGSITVNGYVSLGSGCTLGSGCIIHPGVIVGKDSTVGIGSVVIRNVSPNCTVFGNPAKKLKC